MSDASDLPPPSAELVALRVFAEAHWRSLKPKQRLLFQKALADVMVDMDEAPLTLRQPSEHAAVKKARVRAILWVSRIMQELAQRG